MKTIQSIKGRTDQIIRFGALFALLFGLALPLVAVSNADDLLTKEERTWLQAHDGQIRFAPSPSYAPICFRDESGEFRGLTMDFIKRIETRLGFRFQIIACDSWNEILEILCSN